jgi:hypothetical protein
VTEKNKLKNSNEEMLLTNIFYNINKFKQLYSLTYLESVPALKDDLKKVLEKRLTYKDKMKQQILYFDKINNILSEDLVKIFKNIELKKKLQQKDNSVDVHNAKKSFIYSMLREQPDFTEFFGKEQRKQSIKKSEKKISTAQEFRRYLKNMGILNDYESSRIDMQFNSNEEKEMPKYFEILHREKILFKPKPKKSINQINNKDVYYQIQNYFHLK